MYVEDVEDIIFYVCRLWKRVSRRSLLKQAMVTRMFAMYVEDVEDGKRTYIHILAHFYLQLPKFWKKYRKLLVSINDFYRRRRYVLGIGEGTTDLPPANSFPLECNAAFLNGGKISGSFT